MSDIESLVQPKFDDNEIQQFSTLKSSLFQSVMFDELDEFESTVNFVSYENINLAENESITRDNSVTPPPPLPQIPSEEDYSQFLV